MYIFTFLIPMNLRDYDRKYKCSLKVDMFLTFLIFKHLHYRISVADTFQHLVIFNYVQVRSQFCLQVNSDLFRKHVKCKKTGSHLCSFILNKEK